MTFPKGTFCIASELRPPLNCSIGIVLEQPIFVGSESYAFFKEAAEVLRILEAQLVGNLVDGFARIENSFFGYLNHLSVHVLLGLLLNRVTLQAVVGGNEVTNPFMVTEV